MADGNTAPTPAPVPASEVPILNGTTATETAIMAADGQSISADEIARYDRQIRLWGVQAQEKIRAANVLLLGLKGLGNEVAKNLVLSGIGSLTIADDQIVAEEDLGAQFLVSQADVGKNRAQAAQPQLQALNPRVKLHVNTSSILSLVQHAMFFQPFTIIIATDLPIDILQPLNSACRLFSRPFYAATTFGLYGYIFADLATHTFIIEREKSNMVTKLEPETTTRRVIATTTKKSDTGKTIELVTKTEQYSPLAQVINAPLPPDRVTSRRRKLAVSPALACVRALWRFQLATARPFPLDNSPEDLEKFTRLATNEHLKVLGLPHETLRSEFLRTFLQGVATELSPTCAMLGGELAQNVIHVVGQNEQPIQNLLIWDGEEMRGEIYAMHPDLEELSSVPLGVAAAAAAMNGNGTNGTNGVATPVML